MHVHSLYLKNFRNYEERRFTFGPQTNVICGPNARGKTSILEAIHLLMTGRSFRSSQTKELISHDKSEFYVELTFYKHGVEQLLRMAYSGKERRLFYNQTPCPALTGLIGIVPGTIMIPDDVSMVKGQPRLRRRFLDILLAQSDPLYVHHLTRYQRALVYRNSLLRKNDLKAIDAWEGELAKGAGYISSKRYAVLMSLEKSCGRVLAALSDNKETVQLKYRCQCAVGESDKVAFYLDLFRKFRQKEVRIGHTMVGPHRDDMQILIGDSDARQFASEGQKRSCIAAMRFAEWEYLRKQTDETPLMLIDDIGVSLDVSRRSRLLDHLGNLGQVFITTTEGNEPFVDSSAAHVIHL